MPDKSRNKRETSTNYECRKGRTKCVERKKITQHISGD